MEVSLITSAGKTVLEAFDPLIKLESPFAVLEIQPDKGEQCQIISSDYHAPISSTLINYDISLDVNNTDKIRIICNDQSYDLKFFCPYGISMDDSVIQNLINFSNQLLYFADADNRLGINEFFDYVDNGDISLLCVQEPLTGYDDNSLLEKLYKDLNQKVRSICTSPKLGTKVEELVQDVSLVKRINSNTLMHLSSHSEHWKARTLTGLIPKRLKADVIEDEINIYENIFFKMAIDDIATYTSRQILAIKQAFTNNKNAIDWEYYGLQVNDYKRNELISRLMHVSSTDILVRQNNVYENILAKWKKISKIIMTIRSSSFYTRIDYKQRISKNIHLTNILKNDQRYKALYDLWCLVRKAIQFENKDKSVGLSCDVVQNVRQFYSNYSIMAGLYAMHVNNVAFSTDSSITIQDNYLTVDGKAEDSFLHYQVSTEKNNFGYSCLNIQMKEILDIEFSVPDDFPLESIMFDKLKEVVEYDQKNNKLHFLKKPNSIERTSLHNVLKHTSAELYKMEKSKKFAAKQTYEKWWHWIELICSDSKIHDVNLRTISIVPVLYELEADPLAIASSTLDMFNSAKEYTVFLLPVRFDNYVNIKNEKLLRRLLNYGDSFALDDNDSWKDYRVGVLPMTQTDLGSIQRIIKLLSLHKSLMIMEIEKSQPVHCPVCGSKNIKQIDSSTWECLNYDGCGIRWGNTKCTKGCGESFFWIQPQSTFDNNEFDCENANELILKKDSLFDKFMITDFEIQKTNGGLLTLYPICPKCGARRFE